MRQNTNAHISPSVQSKARLSFGMARKRGLKTQAYIQSLLDKYMEGTTTLEEEDTLHQYFTRSDVPAGWEDYRLLFAEIDSMRPAGKSQRQWWTWSMAAAVVAALVVYATTRMLPENRPEPNVVAQVTANDTTTTQAIEARPHPTPMPQRSPVLGGNSAEPSHKATKPRLRKPQPTMTDYDKAYALMASVKQKQMDVERQIAQAEQDIVEAQLAAYGYIPVMQEDGTIIYINEQTELIAYEE